MASSSPTPSPADVNGDAASRWKATCTVPAHPSRCPACGAGVKIFHMNLLGEALFMCKSAMCYWPLNVMAAHQYEGFSDFRLHEEMEHDRKEKKKKRKRQQNRLTNGRPPTPPPDPCFTSPAPPVPTPVSLPVPHLVSLPTVPNGVVPLRSQTPPPINPTRDKEDTEVEDMDTWFTFAAIPTLMSPIQGSPARSCSSVVPSPRHDSDSEFRRPSPTKSSKLRGLQRERKKKLLLTEVKKEPSKSSEIQKYVAVEPTHLPASPQVQEEPATKQKLGSPKTSPLKLQSLSNKLAMVTGLPISISINVPTTGEPNKNNMVTEITKLTSQVSTVEENQEFRSLIKAMGGSDRDNLDFIQKIQRTLLNNGSDKAGQVVRLFVGQGKSTIDLPNQTLDVSADNDKVKVLLCSESDGIESEALRAPLTDFDQSSCRPRRGRKKKVRTPSPPPTLVPTPTAIGSPYRFNPVLASEEIERQLQLDAFQQQQMHQQQMQQQSCYIFFSDEGNLHRFTSVIRDFMKEYVCPDHFREQGIDPVIAMLFSKMNEPNNAEVVASYQRLMEMYSVYLTLNHPMIPVGVFNSQQPIDFRDQPPTSLPREVETSNRTYHELQTVRGRETATDVLREHQTTPERANVNEQGNRKSPPSSNGIKEEIMEYPETPFNPDSVQMSSVYPGQMSVQEVTGYLPLEGIGQGKKTHCFAYENTNIGPIRVETEEESRVLVAFVKEKIVERTSRGQKLHLSPQYFSAAVRAKSLLRPEVIKYVERAFTQKGMKENVVGRKKRNYPKRSEIIKIDPKTGERILPPMKAQTIMSIKEEMNEEKQLRQFEEAEERKRRQADAAAATTVAETNSYSNLPSPRTVNASIDQILSNTADNPPVIDLDPEKNECSRASTTLSPPFSLMPASLEEEEEKEEDKLNKRKTRSMGKNVGRNKKKETLKISPVLFTNRKRKISTEITTNDIVTKEAPIVPTLPEEETAPLTLSNVSQIESLSSPATLGVADAVKNVPTAVNSGKKIYRGFQSKFAQPSKPPVEDTIEEIISKSSSSDVTTAERPTNRETTPPSKKSRLQLQNVIDPSKLLTRKQSKLVESQNVPQIPLTSPISTWTASFDPNPSTSTSGSGSNVFVRQGKEKRIQKLMKKQLKKRTYRGFGADRITTPASVSKPSRFTPAQVIGGVKKVIKPNGEIVELREDAPSPVNPDASKKPKYVAPIAQEEKDLLQELFAIAEDMF